MIRISLHLPLFRRCPISEFRRAELPVTEVEPAQAAAIDVDHRMESTVRAKLEIHSGLNNGSCICGKGCKLG